MGAAVNDRGYRSTVQIIAKFKFANTAAYSSGLIIFSVYYLTLPMLSGLSPVDFMGSGRYERRWPLGLPGALFFLIVGAVLAYRLLFSNRAALYVRGHHLILMSPFMWKVKISDIVEVSNYNRRTGVLAVDKIRIGLRNGRKKYIGTTLFTEARDSVAAEIRVLQDGQFEDAPSDAESHF
jgi:hypothetical protein